MFYVLARLCYCINAQAFVALERFVSFRSMGRGRKLWMKVTEARLCLWPYDASTQTWGALEFMGPSNKDICVEQGCAMVSFGQRFLAGELEQ